MTKKRKRQLRGSTMVHETDVGRLVRLLPHA
jgi:ribosomal protein L35